MENPEVLAVARIQEQIVDATMVSTVGHEIP